MQTEPSHDSSEGQSAVVEHAWPSHLAATMAQVPGAHSESLPQLTDARVGSAHEPPRHLPDAQSQSALHVVPLGASHAP